MVLRHSPYNELQILCGAPPNNTPVRKKQAGGMDWSAFDAQKAAMYGAPAQGTWEFDSSLRLPSVICDMCTAQIPATEIRWVCESSVNMHNVGDRPAPDSVHRATLNGPVASVCKYCISPDGLIDCGICGETKNTTRHRTYKAVNAEFEYDTPCSQCKRPSCKACLILWSKRCIGNGMPSTTCPFCRNKYEHYTAYTAGWQSHHRGQGQEFEGLPFERSKEAEQKLEETWKQSDFKRTAFVFYI